MTKRQITPREQREAADAQYADVGGTRHNVGPIGRSRTMQALRKLLSQCQQKMEIAYTLLSELDGGDERAAD